MWISLINVILKKLIIISLTCNLKGYVNIHLLLFIICNCQINIHFINYIYNVNKLDNLGDETRSIAGFLLVNLQSYPQIYIIIYIFNIWMHLCWFTRMQAASVPLYANYNNN